MSPEAARVLEILDDMASDAMARTDATDPHQRALDYSRLLGSMTSSLRRLCRTLGADEIADRMERHSREETDRILGHGWRERARERALERENGERPVPVAESLDAEQEAVVP